MVGAGGTRTERARAREALTRIRIRRRLERRTRVRDLSLLVVPPTILVALTLLGAEVWREHGLAADSFTLWSVLLPVIVAAVWAAMGLGGGLAIGGGILVSLAPLWLYRAWRGLRLRRRRDEAEGILSRDGCVPSAWARSGRNHRAAVKLLSAADEALVVTRDGSLRPSLEGPPESCPRCGADLSSVGEGLRRCMYCSFERYEELTACPASLTRARAAVAGARDGIPLMTHRQRWRAFLGGREGARHRRRRRRILIEFGVAFAFGGLLDLLDRFGVTGRVTIAPMGVWVCLVLVGTAELSYGFWEYFDLRFRRFARSSLGYETSLYHALIRALALKGRARIDEVALHLGITRAHLEQVLVGLSRWGRAPLYRDRQRDELLSLHARDAGDNECPTCGGQLELRAKARVSCMHCGTEALAG